jgi:hypothetical protein
MDQSPASTARARKFGNRKLVQECAADRVEKFVLDRLPLK